MAVRTPVPNLEKFRGIKGRVADLYEHCGNLIRTKQTVRCTAAIFPEMDWLVQEVKRLAGGAQAVDDPDRFRRTAAFVRRVCQEQAAVIAGGQFVKVNAEVFSAMRFLVRCVESIIAAVVDDDVAGDLASQRLPDEHTDRIEVDLAAGIADAEPDPEPAPKKKRHKADDADLPSE